MSCRNGNCEEKGKKWNFTENEVLFDLVEKKQIGDFTSDLSKRKKDCVTCNANGSIGEEVVQSENNHRKKRITAHRCHVCATGGGPSTKSVSTLEGKIGTIIGKTGIDPFP